MTAREVPHVFLDTTEVMPSLLNRSISAVGSSALFGMCQRIGASLYVADLVIEEVAEKRLREFGDRYEEMMAFGSYVALGERPDGEALVKRFRDETLGEVGRLGIEVIDSRSVTLEEVVSLSKRIMFGKSLVGFHDIVIVLTCTTFAKKAGLRDSWFVSGDSGFRNIRMEEVPKRYEVSMRVFRADDAVGLMKEMVAGEVSSLEDALPKKITAFMNANISFVHKYLADNQLRLPAYNVGDNVMGVAAPFFGDRDVRCRTTHVSAAVPVKHPVDGEVCEFSFVLPLFPVEEARPRVIGRIRMSIFGDPMPEVYGERQPSFPGVGKGRAKYLKGELVGKLGIDVIRIGR